MSSTIPTTNISFSDIYNVYNDASAQGGTTHNGTDPISISDLISATHPSTDTMASLTPGIDRKFNVIESPSYNIATETTPPRKVLLPSNGISVKFYDNNGPGGDYSNSQRNSITFESTGTSVFIKINSFHFEHSGAGTRMYDRLGIQASDDLTEFGSLSANLNILKSPILSEALYQSVGSTSTFETNNTTPIPATSSDSTIYYNYSNNGLGDGSGGFIFGNISSENDVKGENFSSLLNTWLEIKCRFVHFYFYSDSSVEKSGWDMLVSSGQPTQIGDSGLVPIDWTTPSSGTGENIIQNNGSIILDSTTKNKLYTPVSKFTFSDGPNVLPAHDNTSSNGTITFDAGEGNTWEIDVGSYTFPYASSGFSLFGQLKIESKANASDYFSNVSVSGLANIGYKQRVPSGLKWTTPGHVFPSYNGSPSYYIFEDGTQAFGTPPSNSSLLWINKRYIKFTYDNNVDDSNYAYTFKGWLFNLQVKDSTGNTDVANDYSSGDAVTSQEVNIKDDFMGRTKNYDPSMQIVEYVGGNYTTNILKNSLFGSGNLGIGLKMPIGAYDLTSSDITVFSGNGETITGFSVADGATETNFSVTPPTGSKAYKLKIRVKGNTFYDSVKIWNKPADNDFCWYWNMPIITITSTSVNSGGTTGSQKIPITVSCQHRFDISKVLVQSGLKNATIDGNITILDGSKNATFDIIAVNPSSPSLTTPVILDISKSPYVEAIRELDSGYFYTSFTDITPFTYIYEPDITKPILVVFSFTSSNSTNSVAKKGDTITLVVDSNEQLDISSTSHSVKFRDSSSDEYSATTISYPSSTRMNGTFDIPNSPSLPGGEIGVSEIKAFDLANNSGTVSTALKIKYYVDDFQFTNRTFTRERGGAFTPNAYAPSGVDAYGVALTVGGPIPNNTNWESLSHNDVTKLSYTATDPAGNTKTATLTVTTEDTKGPNVVISYDGTNNLGDKTITFSFTELPIGFDIGGITIEPSGLGAKITKLTTSGLVRTALFSPSELGIYELSVGAPVFKDAAGNSNLPSNKLKILLDTAGITPQTIQIGTGTSTVSRAPFYGLYDYSQFGVIYLATDIHNGTETALGTAGIISSLFFEYASWSTGYTALRQTVKISHTQAIQIERGPNGSGSSYVYPDYGNLTLRDTTIVKRDFTFTNPSSERWEEIGANTEGQSPGFTTNFEWNGTDNILISWENRDGTWTSGYGSLKGNNSRGLGSSRSAHTWYTDDSYPTRASGNNSYSPNIKLVFS